MDTWWQTETGGFMITPLPITPLKPGSATKPFFGNEVDVVDESGKSVKTGEEGNLVIKESLAGHGPDDSHGSGPVHRKVLEGI